MSTTTEIKCVVPKQRVDCFDIARGIGILLMVMGHTGFGMDFDKIIHTFHMPLFFFVSGYFYRPQRFERFIDYLVNQVKTLLVPYMVFAVFYEFLHYLFAGEWSVEYFILSLFTSNHNRIDVAGAMWFLLCLFSAKLIYYVIERRIRKTMVLAVVLALISACSSMLRQYDIMLPLALDSALSCLMVIHIGFLLYQNRENKYVKAVMHMVWWGIVITAILLVATALENYHVNIRRNKFGILPLYWISCSCGILLTMSISNMIEDGSSWIAKATKRILCYWGRESLVFLLLNELMIFVVRRAMVLVGLSRTELFQNYWLSACVVICVMGLLSLIALFSDKKPFCYVFGKWKSK